MKLNMIILNEINLQVDEIACEFLELLKASRDGNNEVPSTFGNDLNKWALESIGCIALDQRLGALEGNDPTAIQMIKNGKEFVKLSYQLDFQPSLWRCIKTPKFYKLMRLLDEHSRYTINCSGKNTCSKLLNRTFSSFKFEFLV